MIKSIRPYRAGLLLLSAAGFLFSACGPSRSSETEPGLVVPQADVERLRIRLLEGLREIDGSLTQLEAQAALVDSTERIAYQQRLDELFDARNTLETRIAALAAGPQASFDSLETALTDATVQLDRRVEKTHFVLAQGVTAVRALSIPRLAVLEERLEKTVGKTGVRFQQLRRALQEKQASINVALENLERFAQDATTRAHWQTVVADRFADLRGITAHATILQDSISRIPQRDTLQTLGEQAFDTPSDEPERRTPAQEATPAPTAPVEREPTPPPAPEPEREPAPAPPPAREPEPDAEAVQEPTPEPVEVEHPADPGGEPVIGIPEPEPEPAPEPVEEPEPPSEAEPEPEVDPEPEPVDESQTEEEYVPTPLD